LFPGGSVTGAPKQRAMQIIEQLEPQRRGIYCGSIGYVGLDGNMDCNIAIRTLVYAGDEIRFWAGGGIVADSRLGRVSGDAGQGGGDAGIAAACSGTGVENFSKEQPHDYLRKSIRARPCRSRLAEELAQFSFADYHDPAHTQFSACA
jgi:hypothetical protein